MKLQKISILIGVLFLLAGCGGEKITGDIDTSPNYGDIFVVAVGAEPVSLNPLFISDTPSRTVENAIFDSLIKFDSAGEPESALAKEWDIREIKNTVFVHLEENSKNNALEIKKMYESNKSKFSDINNIILHKHWYDEKFEILEIIYQNEIDSDEFNNWYELSKDISFVNFKYEVDFFLNDKIKWHDGRDFTAADVEFTYRLLTDKNLSTPYLSNYLTIKSVETSGRYQIKIVYYKPFLNILRPWAVSILPKHILENENNLRESKFNRNPIGTGPYKMLQWVTGEYIILESNTNYHKGKPYFDKTVFKIIPDQSQQFLAMSNGQVDYMQFTFDQYKNYGQDPEFEKRFNIYRLPYQWGYLYVGYNNQKGALANKNIRKALGMGMNVDELAEGAYMGYATRVSGPYRHNTPAYNTDVKLLEFNPDKAKELIKNEGYKLNSNGYFEKDGKILEFSLKTNMDNKEREHMGRYITQYWKNIGVKCNLNLLDWTNFLKDMRNGDFDVVMLGWSLGITPDLYQTWHSDAIPWGGKSGLNYVGFSNSEVDELLEKIRFIPSLEHAYEYTWRVHEIIAEEQPYTFLFAEDYVIVMDKRIYGVNVTENKVLNDWLEWYVPKQLIKYKDGY